MSELVWTKEPPTVQGFYWVRMGAGDQPWVLDIGHYEIDYGGVSPSTDKHLLLPFSELEFAGPLPEPSEPGCAGPLPKPKEPGE